MPERRPRARAADPAELSQRGGGPPRRRRLDPARAKIAGAPALARFQAAGIPARRGVADEDDLAKAAGDIGTTIFHPVGTAKMGRDDDPTRSSTAACVCADSRAAESPTPR